MRGLFSVILGIAGILSNPLQALPQIDQTVIHGFTVQLVDIGRGDSFGVVFSTPSGTLRDQGKMLGRMHLLEHMLFTGSLALPGYDSFNNTMRPAGVVHNAFTSDEMTYYHSVGSAAQAELIIKAQLSMLGGLEWLPDVYRLERNVVINEIDEEYNKMDVEAPQMMGLTKLLPPSHPWAYPRLGDRANLLRMTLGDLKEAYSRHYRADQVKVALIGNFRDEKFRKQVLAWTEQYLKVQPAYLVDPAPPVPSFFSEGHPESRKLLYLHSETVRQGMVTLEVDVKEFGLSAAEIELFVAYMNLKIPGSLATELSSVRGWISDMVCYTSTISTKLHLYCLYEPTDKGSAHGDEIRQAYFAAMASVEHLDSRIIDLLKEQIRGDFERRSRSVSGLMRGYASLIHLDETSKDFFAQVDRLSRADLARVARALSPEKALYLEMGPDASDTEYDTIFRRRYKLIDHREGVSQLSQAMLSAWSQPAFSPEFRALSWPKPGLREPTAGEFHQTVARKVIHERVSLDLRSDLDDTAAAGVFIANPTEVEDLAALDIFLKAFVEHFAGDMSFARMRYQTLLSFQRQGGRLQVKATAEDDHSINGLKWAVDNLAKFSPDQKLLRRAFEAYLQDLSSNYSGEMSANIGFSMLDEVMDAGVPSGMSLRSAALGLELSEIVPRVQRLLARTDKQIVLIGNLDRTQALVIRESMRLLSPKPLSPDDRLQAESRRRHLVGQERMHRRFDPPKGRGAVALFRTYQGPELRDFRSVAAFWVLNSVLDNAVKVENRERNGLGYIHNTAARSLNLRHHHLTFFGQTAGSKKAQKTIDGWNQVLTNFRDGQVTDAEIQSAIDGLVAELTQSKTSAGQMLESALRHLQFRLDARADKRILAEVRELTPQEVRQFATKFFFAPNTPYLEFLVGDCAKKLL